MFTDKKLSAQRRRLIGRLVLLLAAACPWFTSGQTPEWIWHSSTNAAVSLPDEQIVYFRKSFRTPPLLWNARLTVSADDKAEIFLNGVEVATCEQWDRPVRAEVTVRLNQGENVLGVRARNRSGPAGLLVQLGLGGETNVVSDRSWLVSTREEKGWSSLTFNAAHWQTAASLGAHGIAPWGEILRRARATAAESLKVPEGFKVELLRSAEPNEGSWICLTFDEHGRLLISPEGDQRPLLRLTLKEGQVAAVEPMAAPIHYAMGLLFAHGSLYANARGPSGAGLYRVTDVNHNDRLEVEEVQLLKNFAGGSEHGYHALRLGPDGKIYVVNGNGTKPPQGLSRRSAHRNYGQDVLSLNPDELGEAGAEAAVQCHILRTDAEGREWELWAGGMRNAYAFDFSPEGELFAFDSDMEWDWGTPWYRPTRIVHCVSGGDYGWRDGTRTWPEYYEDSLPAVLEVGIGSPTGVRFGSKSRFPEKFRRCLFAMDWSYGRIFAIQLEATGASYRGECETFLQGTPLNLTDLEFGPDGAMYFITGGRATQSGLYRVSYTGQTAAGLRADSKEPEARAVRQHLETWHGRSDPASLNLIWQSLGSSDRWLRYAARVALESQELSLWKTRALSETNTLSGLSALLALARVGGPTNQSELLDALARYPLEDLSAEQRLIKLRVMEVSLVRQGRPVSQRVNALLKELENEYLATAWPLNRELCRLLIYLEGRDVVRKTLDLLEAAPTQGEQFHYVAQLRHVRSGWTLTDRRRYFGWWLKPRQELRRSPELLRWFADVGRSYVDGAWVDRYLREFRADALAGLSSEERRSLADMIEAPFLKARLVPITPRKFIREWTVADLLPQLDNLRARRSYERGRQAFVDAQCIACHRFGNDGGAAGPELTGAGSKYEARSLLESLLEPSKVVSEQFQNVTVFMQNGDSVTGKIVRQTAEQLVVETDPLSGGRATVGRSEVDRIAPSTLSPMPEGLANVLSSDEILDLIAYLQSGGRADAPAFQARLP